jgi:hypothetical protein
MTQKYNGCSSILLNLLGINRKEEFAYPYKLGSGVLSNAELSFYKVMQSSLQLKYEILCKVRLADIFSVTQTKSYYNAYNRIAQKHVDFLLCEKITMKPIIGIELDDKSHEGKTRQERDEFVEKVFEKAKLPLLRIQAKNTYNPIEIVELITKQINKE